MAHEVAKPFNSATRRFKPGDAVAPEDVADCTMSWDDLIAGGFVVDGAAPALPAPMQIDEPAN